MKTKYILGLVLFFLCQMTTMGEEFTHLNWKELKIDTVLPLFTQSIAVGEDYASYRYDVRVEYPEYVVVTKAEAQAIKRLAPALADTVSVNAFLGVSRKSGILDVSFVPLIYRDGKYWKLTSCKLAVNPRPLAKAKGMKTAATSSRYVAHSVLSSGKWVKIRVKEEGVYQLSKSFLSSLGFSNADKVKVYGYGGIPQNDVISYSGTNPDYDDLEEVPLYRRSDALLFYANGTQRWSAWSYSYAVRNYISKQTNNPYSSYSYYFVTEGESPLTMSMDAETAVTTTDKVTTFPTHTMYENDAYSWYTSGRNLYDSYNFADGNSRNYTIATPDADTTQYAAVLLSFTAGNSNATSVKFSMNGSSLGSFTIEGKGQYDYALLSTQTYKTKKLLSSNTFNINTTSGMNARLDYILVDYMRQLKMDGSSLLFNHYLTTARSFELSGADANTQVWRIGSAGNPTAQVKTTLSGSALDFNVEDPTQRYVALDVTATFPSPEKVGQIVNQDLHADSAADMVIIIPESGKLLAQAERLAAAHKSIDSLRVRIVRADQLYNEFSSGTPDACAYRRYLKMLYDRAATSADMPRYLLFFGSCVWDNRMLTSQCKNLSPKDYLLCYESDNSISEVDSYVSDDYFGLLDDGEGGNMLSEKMDVGIGRIPVVSDAQAKIIVDKTITYMQNQTSGAWKNSIFMMADDGNENSHMEDEETVTQMIERTYPSLVAKRIYWDSYQRVTTATGNSYPLVTSDIKNAMKKGALVMNYSGHGAPYSISHEQVLKLADFKEFSSAKVPIWIVASCEITPYDMNEDNIGEASLLNSSGAAIAFYSAARAVYSTQNRYLNNYFMYYLLGKDSKGKRYTLGDASRMTKVSLVSVVSGGLSSGKDYSENKSKYALMGDPALTLAMPTYKVVLDSLNGQAVGTGNLPQLKAGSVVHLRGHVVTADGQALPAFNGAVSVVLMDSKDTITCRNNQKEDITPYVYYERTKTLYEGSDSVRNGNFTMTFPVPLDINYTNKSGRLNFYAVNKEKTVEANGYNEQFTIGGTETSTTTDSQGPAMYVYLNSPDFRDGGTVNETPYFFAELSDSDGINTTGNGIGHDLELIIDGDEEKTYVLNNYYANDFGSYTRGSLSFSIPAMTDGKHRLYFRAWDMKNHSSSTALNFVVKTGLQPSVTDVKLTKNPATTSTTFIISYDRPDVETTFTVKVYDCFGRLWWNHSETATSTAGYYTIPWDLCSNNGVVLPAGLYLYQVGVTCNGSKESTKTQKLIIHRQ